MTFTPADDDDHGPGAAAAHAEPGGRVVLVLLGGFRLHVAGEPVVVPAAGQRLIALLALKRRPMFRQEVAGILWPESSEESAGGCLRTALWRVRCSASTLIVAAGSHLELSSSVRTDVATIVRDARRLLDPHCALDDLVPEPWRLAAELLPGWYDDWVIFEQERFRQLCLHALDALAARLLAAGRHGAAVEAAYTAIRADPLRESAQRLLIQIHLAQANVMEACRSYGVYAKALGAQLGISPSAELAALIAGAGRLSQAPPVTVG